MSRLDTALHNDLKLLRLLRDETVLQAHLLKADMKSHWEELERKWSELETHIERAQVAGDGAKKEAEMAISLLSDTLRSGYNSIRKALKS